MTDEQKKRRQLTEQVRRDYGSWANISMIYGIDRWVVDAWRQQVKFRAVFDLPKLPELCGRNLAGWMLAHYGGVVNFGVHYGLSRATVANAVRRCAKNKAWAIVMREIVVSGKAGEAVNLYTKGGEK